MRLAEDSDDELVVPIRRESDLNHARMIARETCKLVEIRGYQAQKIVTAVSELARNIARYTGGGRIRFRVDTLTESIIVVAEDDGPGITNLDEILSGGYRSRTGLGRGLLGSRELADRFDIQTAPAGTTVRVAFDYGGRGSRGSGSRKSRGGSSGDRDAGRGKAWTTSTR
ncbi:Serine/threonine-protein kinase RsbT [Enhygromyxa salina]|uniref:Serine/threonine-protein kinase RsbT n=1 Tax=Enhygromyxa salina TaxID=215803 RepID=A0A2S9XDV5_9BACT|nr:ATP-binding protein [Enhygromyxa salina]PRP91042.1 Serine/threonine-protein kinase RsbT [Enhygromyxa salina]